MMDMHARCVSILAHLWGVQKGEKAVGTATTGVSIRGCHKNDYILTIVLVE